MKFVAAVALLAAVAVAFQPKGMLPKHVLEKIEEQRAKKAGLKGESAIVDELRQKAKEMDSQGMRKKFGAPDAAPPRRQERRTEALAAKQRREMPAEKRAQMDEVMAKLRASHQEGKHLAAQQLADQTPEKREEVLGRLRAVLEKNQARSKMDADSPFLKHLRKLKEQRRHMSMQQKVDLVMEQAQTRGQKKKAQPQAKARVPQMEEVQEMLQKQAKHMPKEQHEEAKEVKRDEKKAEALAKLQAMQKAKDAGMTLDKLNNMKYHLPQKLKGLQEKEEMRKAAAEAMKLKKKQMKEERQ